MRFKNRSSASSQDMVDLITLPIMAEQLVRQTILPVLLATQIS
jgi:hypothetical protein